MGDDMSKWNFNLDYLEETIKMGNKMLLDKKLSNKMRKKVIMDINVFKNFISGKYEVPSEKAIYDDNYSFIKLKKFFLKDAKEHYEFLGEELINFIINLKKEDIFNFDNFDFQNVLPVEKQMELTLENYKKISNDFYKCANELMIDDKVSQIQITHDADSYCYYSDIVKLPFLIINPSECNNILNHEVQHAIEIMLNLEIPTVFSELGSITLELLFNDKLFEYQNYLSGFDYYDRFDDMSCQLDDLSDYFHLLKKLKTYDFKPNKKEFMDLFSSSIGIKQNDIKLFLIDLLNDCEYDLDICYTLSFLKAIELREQVNNSNCNLMELLNQNYTKFNFLIPNDGFKIYERYIDEMKQKTKKYI